MLHELGFSAWIIRDRPFTHLYVRWVIWHHVLVHPDTQHPAPSYQMPLVTPNIVLTQKSPHQFLRCHLEGSTSHAEKQSPTFSLYTGHRNSNGAVTPGWAPSGVSSPPPELTLSSGGLGWGAGREGSRRVTEQEEMSVLSLTVGSDCPGG